jgi:hypothetical protein
MLVKWGFLEELFGERFAVLGADFLAVFFTRRFAVFGIGASPETLEVVP